MVIMQDTSKALEFNILRKKYRNIATNTYRIQACKSVMRGYFYFGFINFMLKGKSLLEYANLFPHPKGREMNDKSLQKRFKLIFFFINRF